MHQAIDWIREERNQTIKLYLNKELVTKHFEEIFCIQLSKIKFEFLSRDLSAMLIAPVDLVHYASVLNDLTHTHWESPTAKLHHLVMDDLYPIFKKYSF